MLEEIIKLVQSENAELLVFLSPRKRDLSIGSSKLQEYKAFLAPFKKHISIHDLTEELSAPSASQSKLFLKDDFDHYTPFGNRKVADIIFEQLNTIEETPQ